VKQNDIKRKFLIATPNLSQQVEIKTWIEKYVSNTQCAFASDGSDAITKIQNVTPNIVIASVDLGATDGFKLTQWLLRCKSEDKVAIVLLTPAPSTERFVEEVVTSQVQFADFQKGESEVQRVLLNAMSFAFQVTNSQGFFSHSIVKGEQLIKQGEKADNVYLVKSGELEASTFKGTEKVILGKISSGEFVGEMAYINGEPRSADVFATADCELIAMPAGVLDQVLFTKPAWAKALIKTLTKRLKQANIIKAS
jgi:CRP/FNR family cyclic AMP-dependent transcriptional regulator